MDDFRPKRWERDLLRAIWIRIVAWAAWSSQGRSACCQGGNYEAPHPFPFRPSLDTLRILHRTGVHMRDGDCGPGPACRRQSWRPRPYHRSACFTRRRSASSYSDSTPFGKSRHSERFGQALQFPKHAAARSFQRSRPASDSYSPPRIPNLSGQDLPASSHRADWHPVFRLWIRFGIRVRLVVGLRSVL